MALKIGSLFSGVGGLELGLERAGVGSTVWQCEIDPYARAVLAKHWPDAIRFDDITKMHDVPPVDLICGGFPCTDISNAGKREGIHAARSGLFFELMRVVRLVRPRFVVLENVAALLGRGMGDVLGELSESGYDAEWDCVPASSVGAPHRRDRVFIVAYANVERRERWIGGAQTEGRNLRESVAMSRGESGDVADARREGQSSRRIRVGEAPLGEMGDGRIADGGEAVADARRKGLEGRNVRGDAGSSGPAVVARGWTVGGNWLPEPSVGRVAHGIPSRVDRLKCLGNAVVPQVAEVVGRRVVEMIRVDPWSNR